MGGKPSKAEDLDWCNSGSSRNCGSYVLDTARDAPRPQMGSTVDQLLRLCIAWDGRDQSVLNLKNSDLEAKLGGQRWVRGFWAGVLEGAERGHRCCLLIDLAAIYIFGVTTSTGCCTVQAGKVMRIPLRNIAGVTKQAATADGEVPVRISWKPQYPDFDDAGELIWKSPDGIAQPMLQELFNAIALLNCGSVSGHVSFDLPTSH